MTTEEIEKHLLSDLQAYTEFIEKMLTKHLDNNTNDRIYWDAWFNGATGKDLEDADGGKVFETNIE